MGLSAFGCSFGTNLAKGRKPNIVFLFSDDHAIQAIGAYPSRLQEFIRSNNITPNIDRLAREGGLFVNSFCCNSICGPSRAAILTGKHSHINGFMTNSADKPFDGSQWTFPKALQSAGYQTAIVGKWHLISEPTGFDYWQVLPGQGNYYNPDFQTAAGEKRHEGYVSDRIADFSIDWLNRIDQSRPFLLMSQHKAPHRPWMPPLKYLEFLNDQTIPEPETLFDDYANRASPAAGQEMSIDKDMNDTDVKLRQGKGEATGEWKRMTPLQLQRWDEVYGPRNETFEKAGLKGKDLVRWKYQQYMKDYLRCVKAMDDNVGRVIQWLDDNGLMDNTIIIYSSDQGFWLGEHGWFDKRWMYEESLKMPFVIRWPGVVRPGTALNPMIQNIDYAPTLLEMAGLDAPPEIQGRSFVPILKGKTPDDWRTSIYYHYYEYPQWHRVAPHYGIRTERYKLIHYCLTDEWELFDLQKDPQEMRSLYNDPQYADLIKELKIRLQQMEKQYNVPPDLRIKTPA
jgi:arylsulfatase A-like enzyme